MKDSDSLLLDSEIELICGARVAQPHTFLGMHRVAKGSSRVVVRAFLRDAQAVRVVPQSGGEDAWGDGALRCLHESGLFEGLFSVEDLLAYRLAVTDFRGNERLVDDPYRFLPTVSEQDVHLFGEGKERYAFDKLGAHKRVVDGVSGVSFVVWAPHAQRVSVVGNFNEWDGRYHMMRLVGVSGLWELFLPGIEQGEVYKYELVTAGGDIVLKTDPYATAFELAPNHGAKVWAVDEYEWGDEAWMTRRDRTDWQREPVSIYEMHLGSWRRKVEQDNRYLTYRECADELVAYLQQMRFTHVEFMPLTEYPFDGSWGYQVTGFFAPTARFGEPEDFMYLVDTLHQHGFGVIMDWVPAHFPRDAFALAQFDGTALYEHDDPRQGSHREWGTLIFNYGRNEVRGFLINSALFWLQRYHIDGLRVDAVASMLYLDYARSEGDWVANRYGGRENIEAVEFLKEMNHAVHQAYPGVMTIAEESTSWEGVTRPVEQGGLGFDFKWNMGWMNDNLSYFEEDPLSRKYHHHKLTFGMMYHFSESFIQVLSHDEVVHCKGSIISKMPLSDMSAKAANVRAFYAYMWMWPGKKTLFMGNEFAQSAEWNEAVSLDWHLLAYMDHLGVQRAIADLNALYCGHSDLYEIERHGDSFYWLNAEDGDNSVLSFVRHGLQGDFVVLCNFTPVPREAYRVGVPQAGYWSEVFNSNAAYYGGDDVGNSGGVMSEGCCCDGQSNSISVMLPGMSTVIFRSPS